jgi:hypothetical protein
MVYRGQWLGDEDQATTSMHLDCRPEAESESEANPTAELCHWGGACFTPRSKGRAENCANVRHADLRLGKGQGRRQKAIRLSEQHHRLEHR